MNEQWQKILAFIQGRRLDYCRTFAANNIPAQAVLKDLAKFCRANQSTFLPDARAHAVLEGRREVWLRISNHLNMPPDELAKLYSGKDSPQ